MIVQAGLSSVLSLPRALFLVAFAVCTMPGFHNTAFANVTESSRSLAGQWRFALDANDVGVAEKWFERTLAGYIELPGVLQAQGYGDEIRTDTPWVTTLGDAWWQLQPESLRAKFSQPGNVDVPFLSQPPRHYLGAAWYQREIEILAGAAGRRFVLFLERPHWETTVWLDDKPHPANNSLVAPHVTDLGMISPGRHRLTVRIDNRQVVREPIKDGHQADAHAISDALGATWNGIAGRIELQSTSPVWLDDVQVFPSVAKKSALVKVGVGNASGTPGSGTVSAGGVSAPVTWTAEGGSAEFEVSLGENAQAWDEFHPVLQRLDVVLSGPGAADRRTVTFGLREVTFQNKELLLNGRPVDLRTTHFGGDFPLTGYPATDVASWKKLIRVCQDFGMNGIRFHSWCPPEAAFIAADEMGFYLQPECGLWAPFGHNSVYTKYLEEETPRLLKAYGNYASFMLFSPSNEPSARYTEILPQWAVRWYKKDARRLYAAGTGWSRPPQVEGGTQFAVLVRYNEVDLRNIEGWFGGDYRVALESVNIPVLAHETGQWCAYPDFDVINEFTGYLRPGNYRIFRYIAEQTGVLERNKALAWASGRFQLACYKEEIEASLRTPGLAGYQLLDLHDYLGQGTALVGVLDTFWKPKSYVTAEEFRRFNDVTVPLARLSERSFTTGQTLTAEVELYHFGGQPISAAKPYWKVVDVAGHAVASGDFPARDIPIGKNIPIGKVSLALAALPAPAAYRLVVGLTGTMVENDWKFWLYPARPEIAAPAGVLVTSQWAEAEARLADGGKVLFLATEATLDPTRCPPMTRVPVFWNIQMTVRPPRMPTPQFDAMLGLLCDTQHPALAKFPTEANCDWQWAPLIDGVRPVNLTDAPRSLWPIVATIDDWNRNWRLGTIFECNVDRGRLLVSVIDFTHPKATPASRQLGRSLLDYMAGDQFHPAATLTVEQVRQLWAAPGQQKVGQQAREYDPDLDSGRVRPPPTTP